MTQFGRRIRLVIYDSGKVPIFSTEELRVDFHVKNIEGFVRGHYTIYNLNDKTVKLLSEKDRYLKLFVSLHGRTFAMLDSEMYINNMYTEKNVPDKLTHIYGVSALEKDFTTKQIRALIKRPSLERVLDTFKENSSTKGFSYKYVGFPNEMHKTIPAKDQQMFDGKVEDEIKKLSRMYSFTSHMVGSDMIITFDPNARNKHLCNWDQRDRIRLLDDNMKANAVIGVASIKIKSTLDPKIQPSKILDASLLTTAGVDAEFDTLTTSKDIVSNSIAGSTEFNCISTEHKGSNFTKVWETSAYGTNVTIGTKVDVHNWFGGRK